MRLDKEKELWPWFVGALCVWALAFKALGIW